MKYKYIIFENINGIPSVPVIFPTFIEHRVMANAFRSEVVSAGFCEFNKDGFYGCFGESVILKKSSLGYDDAKLIERAGDE